MLLNPVEYVIKLFGGVRPLSRSINRAPGTISIWRKKGFIPTRVQREVLMAARRRRLDLTTDDIILGRKFETEKPEETK